MNRDRATFCLGWIGLLGATLIVWCVLIWGIAAMVTR